MRVAIIGAGPAGWAAASILKSVKGAEVYVFHGGVKDGTGIRDKSSKKTGSIKLLRGSDFPYRDFPFGPKTHEDGVHIPKSFSKAGLSLVWGATMLPYAQSDIQHWPISTRDLEYGYKFVSERMPISGREDRLATTFMPYFSQPPLQPTNRILRLLEIADSRPESDITIGSSRLAIFNTTRKEQGCNYCDLCLQGCPTEKIWSAPSIVSSNIHYLENFRIVGIKEIENKVILSAIDDTGESHEFGGFDKIFLAAGNVESFRILATSGCVDKKVVLKDSATFYIPLLISLKYRRVDKSKYSLSQAFMRIKTSNQKACQLQIYDFSEDLVHHASKASAFGKIVPFVFFRILLQRMFVSIGYLDSDNSPQISMSLDKRGDVLLSKGISSFRTVRQQVRFILKSNQKEFRKLGLWPLKLLIQDSKPGGGAHTGGWLPMGQGSDLLGRPLGMKNVHVIDSSILPSIPAGAITFTVMANAVRITEEACK